MAERGHHQSRANQGDRQQRLLPGERRTARVVLDNQYLVTNGHGFSATLCYFIDYTRQSTAHRETLAPGTVATV